MKSLNQHERVFPLSTGSWERPVLHAPRLTASLSVTSGLMLGHSSLLRAWAARRAKSTLDANRAQPGTHQLRETAASLR